jgi:hypothetical protein
VLSQLPAQLLVGGIEQAGVVGLGEAFAPDAAPGVVGAVEQPRAERLRQ